jgi:predicted Rossmann fold flavoprotein
VSASYDVIILGAGGAGMMCAAEAGKRGRRVLVLDHASKLGGKILISGGGRCNFTNLAAGPANYDSENPHFSKSALSRYPSSEFIALVRKHGIAFEERKWGQLFCEGSAQAIVTMLKKECDEAGAEIKLLCQISSVVREETPKFRVSTSLGEFHSASLVIATGGLSIPKLGATGLGYAIAEQFGLKLVERAAALDGLVFDAQTTREFSAFAGLSIDCEMQCKGLRFREAMLFTHSGLSGPVTLQVSLHWRPGAEVRVNLLPDLDAREWLLGEKRKGSRALVKNLLSERLPSRFAAYFCDRFLPTQIALADTPDKALEVLASKLHEWVVNPVGTVGYNKAEVTRGGVDTSELSSKTLESKKVPGLYFIGEVVDVTGWLGGYNFQWAWASGWASGQVV